jgi:hypothetical protein
MRFTYRDRLLTQLAHEIGQVTLREVHREQNRWQQAFPPPRDYVASVPVRWCARLRRDQPVGWGEESIRRFLAELAEGQDLPWTKMGQENDWEELGLQLLVLEELAPEHWQAVWALHALGRGG